MLEKEYIPMSPGVRAFAFVEHEVMTAGIDTATADAPSTAAPVKNSRLFILMSVFIVD
jgi:hypothetical protein